MNSDLRMHLLTIALVALFGETCLLAKDDCTFGNPNEGRLIKTKVQDMSYKSLKEEKLHSFTETIQPSKEFQFQVIQTSCAHFATSYVFDFTSDKHPSSDVRYWLDKANKSLKDLSDNFSDSKAVKKLNEDLSKYLKRKKLPKKDIFDPDDSRQISIDVSTTGNKVHIEIVDDLIAVAG